MINSTFGFKDTVFHGRDTSKSFLFDKPEIKEVSPCDDCKETSCPIHPSKQ